MVFFALTVAFAAAGALFVGIPLYFMNFAVFTGWLVAKIDHPSKWYGSRPRALALRLITSFLTTAILTGFMNITEGGYRENIMYNSVTWLLYILALGVSYRSSRSQAQDTESELTK